MSCEGVITPPMTPPKSHHSNDDSFMKSAEAFSPEIKDQDEQGFVCQGRVDQDYASLASSLIQSKSGDLSLFLHGLNAAAKPSEQNAVVKIQLFGRCFDRGSALIERTDYLFQNVRKILLELDRTAHPHKSAGILNHGEERYRRYRIKERKFRITTSIKKVLDYAALRKEIIEFCLYVRNYILRLHCYAEGSEIISELVSSLVKHISSLHHILDFLSPHPGYVFEGASSKNTDLLNEHHLCHLQLDLQWLLITIVYVIVIVEEELLANAQTEQPHQHSSSPQMAASPKTSEIKDNEEISLELLDRIIDRLLRELIQLSTTKFKNIKDSLLSAAPFSCSCIFHLWILLYPVITVVHKKFKVKSFWDRINEIFNRMLELHRPKSANEGTVSAANLKTFNESSLPVLDEWMNFYPYIFWMLLHITKAQYASNLSEFKVESNYPLLEKILTGSLEEGNVRPSQLRECLAIAEILTTEYWEPNSSAVLILWDYFHRTIDQGMFLIQGEQLQNQWILSESALSFLNQIQAFIEPGSCIDSAKLTIYKQFLRILAAHLRRCKDTPRVWNQIKSRIFSKFSARKISNLTEPGLMNFFALFLTLAIAGDAEEVCKVTSSLIGEVEIDRRMTNRRKVLWKGYLAMALLTLEKQKKVDSLVGPMIQMINADLAVTDSERMLSIFFEAFQEMLIAPCGLQFGQLSFIDAWVEKCITSSSEVEKNNLLSICFSVLCFLNAELSKGVFKIDSGEAKKDVWQLQVKLWSHLIPHLKQLSCRPYSEITPQIAGELLAAFINFSLMIGLNEVRTEKVKALFKHLLCSESVQIGVMKGYLKELIKHDNALRTLNTPQIFVQAWLKCSFLHEERVSTELSDVAEYIRLHLPNNRLFRSLTLSKGDIFIDFIKALRSEFNLCADPLERKKFCNEAAFYFGNLEKWSSQVLKNLTSQNEVLRIHERAGFLVSEAGAIFYAQSGTKTLLHRLLEIFLLPPQVRDPAYDLHPFVAKGLHHNLNLFIQGLVRLGAPNDLYLFSAIKDSLSLLMPRLIRKSGALNDTCTTFSLLKCFTECLNNVAPQEDCCIIIFQIVVERLIKKRCRKNEPNHTLQAIAFIADVASINRNRAHTVQCIIDCCLESIASVAMFYDKGDPCQKNAERLINGILTIHIVSTDPNIRLSAMNLFSKLCRDHLAFYSLKLFDLFAMIAGRVPTLLNHFLPQLIQHVETVEKKRGVTYDSSLRDKGIKRIEQILSGG
ncbi:unnamed protein product [Bemisia tabaci]|uniref:Protein MMS22-like n=1 Tax=Bemisia tabaci TaxID=7038 RepID=A0A9P0AAT8_BEMTA|nr:unnamed protein product [Bemisia tabaci]